MKILTDIINKNKSREMVYPFGSDECDKYLKERYKNSKEENVLINENLYEKLQEYDDIISNINKLESRKKVIEHIMKHEMKEYETAFCIDRKITWKKVTKNSIDTKKLKTDYPNIVKEYMKVSSSRVFKIK